MENLKGYARLAEFMKLADKMIADASKEDLAEAARMLAIQLAHYRRKFGDTPADEAFDLLTTETLDEEQAGWVSEGMEELCVALESVKDEEPPTVQ